MMECEVIRDLLPSYVDGLCSARSRELVEEHLADCPECARAAEAMRRPVRVEPEPVIRAASPFYALKKKQLLKTVIAVAVTAAVCFAAFLGWQYFVENYPPVQPVLSRVELGEENQWRREEETVVFDSVFHRREVVNDIDSDSAADLRLLDGQGNVVLEATVEPGQAVKLEGLERNTPYTVEVRGGPFLLLRFF